MRAFKDAKSIGIESYDEMKEIVHHGDVTSREDREERRRERREARANETPEEKEAKK